MDHTHIVRAGDLERYANTRECQAVLPELIFLLVKQSVPRAIECRIPYGDAVNQPGWDGLVETEEPFPEFVPIGKSYWEIGSGAGPQDKATTDFTKRTKELSGTIRASASFVFVTPRSATWSEPDQSKWLEKRKDSGWKLIRIIDGVKLADWLREFPALGQWMAKKIGLSGSLGGLSTPREHWELILDQAISGDPPLPPSLFTVGRTNVCNAVQALFEGRSQRLLLFAESPLDVPDFLAAYFQTLDEESARNCMSRCLFVSDEEAWREVTSIRKSHVLLADPRLELESEDRADLQTMAIRNGHGVIIPLCGAWSAESPDIIKLRSPSQSQIEVVLKEANYSDVRSRELASIGADRVSALRRHLHGLGTLPPYGTWENARLLAQAGLAGKWDGKNPADQAALGKLLGKEYGEWIETLRSDALRSDSPLIQRNEKWRFVARGEAWNALGNRLVDDDLDRLEETAIAVLGEQDPTLDLPKEERFSASLQGVQLEHSLFFREGLAETLTLVGSRPEALSSCSIGKPEATAILVVRELLSNADWRRWASLDPLLPLLAEAAPDEFLDSIESALIELDSGPFHGIFAQEGRGGLGGSNYMTGLLWALEALAWNPDLLVRVAVILSDVASIDPGGNWANRPANSLGSIFLPWHTQTCAPPERRRIAVETILREQPQVGWKLLLGLLPHNHGFTTGCHKPVWRNYIPREWTHNVTRKEYWREVAGYTELAVKVAKSDIERLGELIGRLPDLPERAHENVLGHLVSSEVSKLSEAERLPIWESLDALVRQHRKFSDAKWAMPAEVVARIEEVAVVLAPRQPELKYRQVFSDRDADLFEEKGSYKEQEKHLADLRCNAVREILDEGGVPAVRVFGESVAVPFEVGRALGAIAREDVESAVLPLWLSSKQQTEIRLVSGFVCGRFQESGWPWVDTAIARDWSPEEKSALLVCLPFEEQVWNRVTESLGQDKENLYWQKVSVNPYGVGRDLSFATEKLIEYGRPDGALLCVWATSRDDRFDRDAALRSLVGVLDDTEAVVRVNPHQTVDVIKRLQNDEGVDADGLFKVEWGFLPWLSRFSDASPKLLEGRLASDAAFFAQVVGIVFQSEKDDEMSEKEDERIRGLAKSAYRLLTEWETCPGELSGESEEAGKFEAWLAEAMRLTAESGHARIAQMQIGNVLIHAPEDPDGLWIHRGAATALNVRDREEMREGFTTALYNQRGVHGFTGGKEEHELAGRSRARAVALEERGYSRVATAMRELAQVYDREGERESKRSCEE